MNILIIGSGGREHAFAWKISQSKKCSKLFVAPGNAGTSSLAENINISVNDFEKIGHFVVQNNISLVVVGPEDPLVKGIRNYFESKEELKKIALIGPDKIGAQLEGSKDFAKEFMKKHNVPTAQSKTFYSHQIEEGLSYLSNHSLPIVLKADGLAAGKGVIISESVKEAQHALKEMLVDKKFGEASNKVVIEQYLDGIELSVFVLTDGVSYKILPEAKDYKRIGEGDTGLNTGGMGAVSPVPFATPDFMKKVEEKVVKPTIKGLKDDKIDYKGFVFIGLMNVKGDPFVIEYNVRMGDPETEVVLPRIKSDLVDLFMATANETLDSVNLETDPKTATTVVMVSDGYPGDYDKNKIIAGLDDVSDEAIVFHAGTKSDGNSILTNGGRVLALTGLGKDIAGALKVSFEAADKIKWDGSYYRKDIGNDLIRLQNKAVSL